MEAITTDTDSQQDHSHIRIHGLHIPDDVCYCIISFLSVRDICSLASCSKQWQLLCSSNFIWNALYQKRWQLMYQKQRCLMRPEGFYEHGKNSFQDWIGEYISLHKQMSMGASTVIEYIKTKACYDSVEVAEYQKAMALLVSTGLEFQDVQMFMFFPKHSVLVNLLGLHYCLTRLKTKYEDAKEALQKSKVGERQICLRWWSLGGWANGYRRHDEMHMRIASLTSLTQMEPQSFLDVIDRGILHEVLRVQISADFESSAWVARSMHSQR